MNLNAREPPTELPVPKMNFRNKTQYLTGPTNPNKSKICFCCNRQKRFNADCFQAEAVKNIPQKLMSSLENLPNGKSHNGNGKSTEMKKTEENKYDITQQNNKQQKNTMRFQTHSQKFETEKPRQL